MIVKAWHWCVIVIFVIDIIDFVCCGESSEWDWVFNYVVVRIDDVR